MTNTNNKSEIFINKALLLESNDEGCPETNSYSFEVYHIYSNQNAFI